MMGRDLLAIPTDDTRSLDFGHGSFAWGFFGRVYGPDVASYAAFLDFLWFEFGYDDPSGSTVSFSNVSKFPKGTGTATLNLRTTVPLHVGVSIAANKVGIQVPNLWFEIFGGANLDQWKSQFALTEAGAPAGAATSAARSYWLVDPAVGIGVKYALGNGFAIGLNSTWAFAEARSVMAQSPNFPSESYTLTSGRQTTTAVKFTLSKVFGGPVK
jgi:hypothetical protein